MRDKGFAPMLVVVIAALFMFGYVAYRSHSSKTPSVTPIPTLDISGWVEYSDKNSPFTFIYDESHYIIEQYNESKYSKDFNSDLPSSFISFMGYKPPQVINAVNIKAIMAPSTIPAGDNSQMQIWVFGNKDSLTIDQWYEKYGYYPSFWGKGTEEAINKDRPRDGFHVNGVSGKQTFLDAMGKAKFAYISKGDKIYLFFGRNINYDEKSNVEIFPNDMSTILSTFQFTQ